ncbi:MAG: Smr/MutS family protein, partial [Clostridia bacterium]|nr:Smr/MutS family protein [Clostridia bacterium]
MLEEMKDIFAKDEYDKSDLVKMATLKNKIYKESDLSFEQEKGVTLYQKADIGKLKKGDVVFVSSLNNQGVVDDINLRKKTVWVIVGQVRYNAKIDDLSFISNAKVDNKKNAEFTLKRAQDVKIAVTELNVIGKNADESIMEVDAFLDKAILSSLEEVRIVHGKGLRILGAKIHAYLKTDKRVLSYRFGKYGEGEDGVTIVTLK